MFKRPDVDELPAYMLYPKSRHQLDIERAGLEAEAAIPEMFHIGFVEASFPAQGQNAGLFVRQVLRGWINGISVYGTLYVLRCNPDWEANNRKGDCYLGCWGLGPDHLIAREDPATGKMIPFTEADKQPWRDYLRDGFHL